MSLIGRLLERRTLTPQQAWGRGLDPWKNRAATGESIDLDKAMTLPAFARCVNLYVDDIVQCPWDFYRRVGDSRVPVAAPVWVDRPTADPNYTWTDHVSDVVFSLVTDRNAFLRCYPDRFRIEAIEVLEPERVQVRGTWPVPSYTLDGRPIDAAQIVHIRAPKTPGKLRATSRVTMLAETIALGLAAEQFGGAFFANGSVMSGMVEVPAGVQVDAKELRENIEKAHKGKDRAHAIGVLTGGATFRQTQSTARDSQLLELHESVVEDVARGFGVPPYLAGSTSPGAVAYASTSNARVDYVVHGVVGLVHRIEKAYSTLVPGADTFARIGLNALLRGDQAARYAAYVQGLTSGRFLKVDEVRAWEDLEPFGEEDGGGFVDTPNNSAGQQPTPPPVEPTPVRSIPEPAEDTVPVVIHNHIGEQRAAEPVTVHNHITNRPDAEQEQAQAEQRAAEVTTNMRVADALLGLVEELRQREPMPTPIVNVQASAPVVIPAPEVRVDVPATVVNVPTTQDVRIVGLPPLKAKVNRDRTGRIDSIEES